MRFLIITQDLHITGTSQGIIERSFLSNSELFILKRISMCFICVPLTKKII